MLPRSSARIEGRAPAPKAKRNDPAASLLFNYAAVKTVDAIGARQTPKFAPGRRMGKNLGAKIRRAWWS
jgi:hypothetical protein